MMKFLIVTEPNDIHAVLVSLVLQSFEHQVVNLFSADFPTKQSRSVWMDDKGYMNQSQSQDEKIEHVGYDVVWWRRPRIPYLPREKIHQADLAFYQRENQMFHDSYMQILSPRSWWINRKEAAIRANYKLLQLRIASEVGMNIPATLSSNSPEEIIAFYRRYHQKGMIYKPLTYQAWQEGNGYKLFYTTKIEDLTWLDKKKLQGVPGIYQEYVTKKYELRVTCFGDYIVAAKINSQIHTDGKMDWRRIPPAELSVEPYDIPEKLKQQIRFLMRELGIVFGCIDFIVTPDNQYVFLEVNEQGQFLFLEEQCEDLPMLDMFIYFLLRQSINYHWIKNKKLLKMADFYQQSLKVYAMNMQKHIYRRNPLDVFEEKAS